MIPKKISIIGLGLIGGSIAKALHKNSKNYLLQGFDKPGILSKVIEDGEIKISLDSIEQAADSDFIFLCLPTELSLKALETLAPLIDNHTVITDVCGVKGVFEENWSKLKSRGIYIGGHPMTGKEAGGYINSDPILFENSVYVVSDKYEKNEKISELLDIIRLLGARIRYLDPFIHDRVISRVSHLPQLISVILVNAAAELSNGINYLDFAAGGFRDMTRIASSNFDIWKSVLKLNREEIIDAIEIVHKNLTKLEDILEEGSIEELEKMFSNARTRRDAIPKNTKGFINPLVDVFVYVKDEPGVLSRLTTLLYENDLNIKDIELLKIREGTGGTFRVSFDCEKTAEKAKLLIEESGFSTK